jgi:hypothetical protein
MISFKGLFYPLNQIAILVKVLQAGVCCFSLQHGVSGFISDTIVINNQKRKW